MASETQMPPARDAPTAGPRLATADSQRADDRADMTTAERRLLAAMPLHAITALHGEAGLRERFAIEIASFSDDDRRRAARALELAARLHAGDRRQREPYVNHLLRVAIRIITYYGIRDADESARPCCTTQSRITPGHWPRVRASNLRWLCWPSSSASGWPGWWRLSRTRRMSRNVTVTSSTANTWLPVWKSARGLGSSRPPTSPITVWG
jgi:hypothetical protein